MALGDSLLCSFRVSEACWAFENAILHLNLTTDVTKLFKKPGRGLPAADRDELSWTLLIQTAFARMKCPDVQAADFITLLTSLASRATAPTSTALLDAMSRNQKHKPSVIIKVGFTFVRFWCSSSVEFNSLDRDVVGQENVLMSTVSLGPTNPLGAENKHRIH
jgi:hypothetical protein